MDSCSEDEDGDGIEDDVEDLNGDGYPDLPQDTYRLVIIPIVDDFPNGRDQVQVVGFAAFYIEGFGEGGSDSIQGRFVRYVASGELYSDPGYGITVVKLTQ